MNSLATVILAAGKGTRMRSPDKPKVLHELAEKPMIQWVIDAARQIHSTRIVLVVGYKADLIQAKLADQPDLEFVVQAEQLGTGHALLQTQELLKDHQGPILVLSGDVPLISDSTLLDMIAYHRKNDLMATLASFEIDHPKGYGRIHRNCLGRFVGIVEEKDIGEDRANLRKCNEVNAGIYLFQSPQVFEDLPKITNHNTQGEYYLPDLLDIWLANPDYKCRVTTYTNDNIRDEAQGINTKEQLLVMEHKLLSKQYTK